LGRKYLKILLFCKKNKKFQKRYCRKGKSVVDFESKSKYTVYDLQRLVELLRDPGGCPWDAEQTHESIRRNLLEEAYETAEAIDIGDTEYLCEELGDVLMQVVFHADIEERIGNFTLDDVADVACKKLIRRHPHIFGNTGVKNSSEVLKNWEIIKSEERKHETVSDEMRAVARSLPALWRAEKIQKKAAKVGFDWHNYLGALDAIKSELSELEEAAGNSENVAEELGDLLFSAVNLARFFSVDPEEALGQTIEKFITRFSKMEDKATELGQRPENMTLEEMDKLYNQAKLEE
jgi:tetrapyrrole methylase family protein/MazG family protein